MIDILTKVKERWLNNVIVFILAIIIIMLASCSYPTKANIDEKLEPIKKTQERINCSLTNYVLEDYKLNRTGVNSDYVILAEVALSQLENDCTNVKARQTLEFILENSTPIFRLKELLVLSLEE